MLQPGFCEVQPLVPTSLHASPEHVTVSQNALEPQVTSHAHALPQLMPRHEPGPLHWMSHAPVPQVTLRQLL